MHWQSFLPTMILYLHPGVPPSLWESHWKQEEVLFRTVLPYLCEGHDDALPTQATRTLCLKITSFLHYDLCFQNPERSQAYGNHLSRKKFIQGRFQILNPVHDVMRQICVQNC
ncbi:hypothetical protein AVEN_102405-1 [Araneus ventricosus]|uniref:Uncharacterized protein n=1 Tax=Araneus ventricosus TaxID=182803 RepID=A0A4Y2DTF7_ARAVE|nr:hypothetical protein AVEN_102405-1 [Araneus ventricosus]